MDELSGEERRDGHEPPAGEETGTRRRERTTMDGELPPADDAVLRHEEAAAAAAAAEIGGPPHPAESDEAARPLEEAGEGVAEGYEESERELVERATHGEDRWTPEAFPSEGGGDRLPAETRDLEPQAAVPEASADRVQPSYSDPDALAPTELRTDVREDAPEPDEAPIVAPQAASLAPREGEPGPPDEERSRDREAPTGAATRREGVARGLSVARIAIGAAYLAAPRLARPTWIGRAGALSGTRVVTAGLGARDIALGLGTLAAIGGGTAERRWLQAQFASDLADFAATLVHGRDVETTPRTAGLLFTGAATAIAGFAAFAPDE